MQPDFQLLPGSVKEQNHNQPKLKHGIKKKQGEGPIKTYGLSVYLHNQLKRFFNEQ